MKDIEPGFFIVTDAEGREYIPIGYADLERKAHEEKDRQLAEKDKKIADLEKHIAEVAGFRA